MLNVLAYEYQAVDTGPVHETAAPTVLVLLVELDRLLDV